ncbi:FKBP-type peptidyl-prolyl cis-trans isomerase (trigger factor) [Methanocalculus alkaliphilus]|uniref:SurA N-terminal domain-containing protein n=1 Tax=Methanocalculus alkaliphilus TaxID=768730 RepID=UPI00209DD7AF|nr:SurA N-terminal domain-containing protein [Methanocalculus alkaliphilus]MCP1715871.1 FKBP-type peptidyl-prolyl cis-trans isomerase (trigger factor) [Methanocalculus alkaliphilus]
MKRELMICMMGLFLLFTACFAGCVGESPEGIDDPMVIGDPGSSELPDQEMNEDDGFQEARPHLEQQLRMEAEQQLIQAHLTDLTEQADIRIDDAAVDGGADDSVVAVVNGEEITRSTMVQAKEQDMQQLMMMGMDFEGDDGEEMLEMLRHQAVNNLISTTLITQKAAEQGIIAHEEDIDAEYDNLAMQFGGEDMLKEQLSQAGMTVQDLRSEILEYLPLDMYVQAYLDEHLDDDMVTFSEDELRALYEQQQSGFPLIEE